MSASRLAQRLPPSRESRAADRLRGAAWRSLPLAVFLLLAAISWKRWLIPFQDSGREMNIPVRLLAGEVLYRDVGYYFGPLPPYLDALALRLFGRDLDVLIALRIAFALLGVEALYRLATRLAPDPRVAAAVTGFVVAVCAFGLGGAWSFPYSVAALEGTVGVWWGLELALASGGTAGTLAAGAVAGLAAGTKLEMVPAALAGVGSALVLKRPPREAVAGVVLTLVLAFAALGGPVILLGREVLSSHGFLFALQTPPAWRHLYERHVLFGGYALPGFLSGGFLDILIPSLPFLAFGFALGWLKGPAAGLLAALAFSVGVAGALFRRHEELHLLLPAAFLVLGADALRLWRTRRDATDPLLTARVAVGLAMAPALIRQPLFLRNDIYGAFAVPLALSLALTWIALRTPRRAILVAFVCGLTLAQIRDRWAEYRMRPWTWVDLPGARLFLPPEEARLMAAAAGRIETLSRPGARVAVFPEPGFLLFTTGRRSPFIDEEFHPQHQDERSEEEMIVALGAKPPEVILVTNRPFTEFGRFVFGDGILDRFFRVVSARYRPVGVIGGPQREFTRERRATEAMILAPVALPAQGDDGVSRRR